MNVAQRIIISPTI